MMASLTRACGKGRPLELRPQLLQNSDDLFFRKPFALHALVLVLGQSELQTGLSPRGKVTGAGFHSGLSVNKRSSTCKKCNATLEADARLFIRTNAWSYR